VPARAGPVSLSVAGRTVAAVMQGFDTAEHEGPEDPWSAYLPGQELVPTYLVSRYAAQYRAIVEVLLAEQDTSLTGLAYDEVAAAVRAHLAHRVPTDAVATLMDPHVLPLDARLERLERWHVVIRWQEPARTGEDFLRRRDRYQLTPIAARLHSFWLQADDTEESTADLTLAPRAIHDRMVCFANAIRSTDYRTAAAEFQQISTLHHAMATAARSWQRALAHAMSGGPDPGKQELLWTTLQSYIGMWGEQVDVHSPRICDLIGEVGTRLTAEVWRACVRSALADDAADELVATQAQRWARTWDALGSWFGGADGQARRLRRQLRDLVAPWARNMHILMDTGGAVTRRAELLQLATTIERAPDEATAWRIWDTATGAFSARHLLLPSDATDDHCLPWALAPAAPITARFREQGTRAAIGRRTKIPDYSAGKAAARRTRLAALAARGEAEASLRQRSGTNLAGWGQVSDAELELLLEFVSVARRASAGTGTAQSVTGDGRWRITLRPPQHLDRTTTLRSSRGRLVTLDWYFEMEPA
jgi:uncharacterized protein (TIGR02677 family)